MNKQYKVQYRNGKLGTAWMTHSEHCDKDTALTIARLMTGVLIARVEDKHTNRIVAFFRK